MSSSRDEIFATFGEDNKSKTVLPFNPRNPGLAPAPVFTEVDPLRQVEQNLGEVLRDLEERMPPNHPYRDADRITWAHETTHGLHSRIRNQNFAPGMPLNAVYVLYGVAILVQEPAFRLADVARAIPTDLRGQIYTQYLVRQQRSWNDRPLYVWDEWGAYTNGSLCRLDLEIAGRAETVRYMLEMAVYGSYLAMLARSDVSAEGRQRQNACAWLARRSVATYQLSAGREVAADYLKTVWAKGQEVLNFWDSLDVDYTPLQA